MAGPALEETKGPEASLTHRTRERCPGASGRRGGHRRKGSDATCHQYYQRALLSHVPGDSALT